MKASPAIDPDHLAELEEERRFLLRSLRDLQREHEAGDVTDEDFETLRAGYTSRAATVLRAIEAGADSLPRMRRRPLKVVAAWVAGTVVVGSLAGWALASAWGTRLPGQTITGGAELDEVTTALSEARQLLGVDSAAAARTYQRVLALEPENTEALTYLGWITAISGDQIGEQAVVDEGIGLIRRAVDIDDTYADPHCFLAIASANFAEPADTATARAEAQRCLDAGPPAQMRSMIESFLVELELTPSTTTG
jgi:hypothetical protein